MHISDIYLLLVWFGDVWWFGAMGNRSIWGQLIAASS